MAPRAPKGSAPKVVDLFAGAGGISEGFRQAGFEISAGSDFDPDAAATYARNFPKATTIVGDVRDSGVRQAILKACKGADVLVGGPPCQAFSQVRNHSRVIDDPRNALYREFVQVLGKVRPPAFLVENVTGMDQMGVREQIRSDLELGGTYDVLDQVVDAADFGVPQTRKRLLFVGVRADVGNAPMLVGTGATSQATLARFSGRNRSRYQLAFQDGEAGKATRGALAEAASAAIVSVEHAIGDLASLEAGARADELPYAMLPKPASAYQREMREGAGPIITNVQVPRINEDTRMRLESIPPGGNHRDLPERLTRRYITGQKWGQDNGSGKLSRRHFYAYRRLHPGIWAWTLNTKGDSVYHYSSPRALSVREFARLQSFPDRFTFTTDPRKGPLPGRHDGGPAHSRYRQVGNAVPPKLARAAAMAIAAAIGLRSQPLNPVLASKEL